MNKSSLFSLFSKSKIINGLKFLLFLEENPKHQVVESSASAISICILCGLSWIAALFLSGISLRILASYGVFDAGLFLACMVLIPLEILHIIYDR